MNKEDIGKATRLLEDLNKMSDLKSSVTVDKSTIYVSIPFTTTDIAQKVATIIAHSLNGSSEMNALRKEIKREVKSLIGETR